MYAAPRLEPTQPIAPLCQTQIHRHYPSLSSFIYLHCDFGGAERVQQHFMLRRKVRYRQQSRVWTRVLTDYHRLTRSLSNGEAEASTRSDVENAILRCNSQALALAARCQATRSYGQAESDFLAVLVAFFCAGRLISAAAGPPEPQPKARRARAVNLHLSFQKGSLAPSRCQLRHADLLMRIKGVIDND